MIRRPNFSFLSPRCREAGMEAAWCWMKFSRDIRRAGASAFRRRRRMTGRRRNRRPRRSEGSPAGSDRWFRGCAGEERGSACRSCEPSGFMALRSGAFDKPSLSAGGMAWNSFGRSSRETRWFWPGRWRKDWASLSRARYGTIRKGGWRTGDMTRFAGVF